MSPRNTTAEAVIYHSLPATEDGLRSPMAFGPILSEVWREACRHIEIAESTGSIASILARHTPVRQIVVRRLDREKGLIETVAMSAAGDLPPNAACSTLPRGGSDAVAAGEGCEKPVLSRDLPSPLVPRDPPGGMVKP
ncbi:MAG: hypothetical protein U1E05_16865, partial [Patescibacteria group bacterium]|nr:hypothetical protein [Patescibacteria group bacterium]